MTDEFKKARDEAFHVSKSNIGDHPLNHYRREGADWAYDWLKKKHLTVDVDVMNLKKVEVLTKEAEALAETLEKMINDYCDGNSHHAKEALARWKKFRGKE